MPRILTDWPRILTYCAKCGESLQGCDGAVCRYCHEMFCEDCGDIGVRECNECGDESAAGEAWRQREVEERNREVDYDDEESEFGDVRDIDWYGDDEAA